MLHTFRKIIPTPLLRLYHRFLADAANLLYRSPSERMVVIGITGTSGKSTVCYILAKMLEHAGFRVGLISTIMCKVDTREWVNEKKMTMVGRFQLQKLLADMAKANCQFAIVETTSQGIVQFRHRHIAYDVMLCTNLYPEHIESHGGFEQYKQAKLTVFRELQTLPTKTIAGQTIPKTIVVNLDDEHSKDFAAPVADRKYGFTQRGATDGGVTPVSATDVKLETNGSSFVVQGQQFRTSLLGSHNVSNALAAITVGLSQGLSPLALSTGLASVSAVPGRLEFIVAGQPFTVVVDYAFEPRALQRLYDTVATFPHQRLIQVLGATGGGRDRARRPVLGKLSATHAEIVIVTTDDPYDDDPMQLQEELAAGARAVGKRDDKDLFFVPDRRQAIHKALSLARPGDVVLVTGKGSEQVMAVAKRRLLPWDDRKVVREELQDILRGSYITSGHQ